MLLVQAFVRDGDLKDLSSLICSMEDQLEFIFVNLIVDLPAPPLCQDWTKYVLTGDTAIDGKLKGWHKNVMRAFDELHASVVQANRERAEAIWTFDPWVLAVAVTV